MHLVQSVCERHRARITSLYAHQCNQFARGIAPAVNSISTRVIHANGVCSTPATGKRYYGVLCLCITMLRAVLPCYALCYHVTRCFTGLRDVLCDMSSSIVSLVK